MLKEDSIATILNDFFDELIKNFEITYNKYKKSNDNKYLTEIKNITGNSINDVQLKDLMSSKKEDFVKKLKNLFDEKKKSRVEILGEQQNKILEKKDISSNNRFFLEVSPSIFRTIKTSNWIKTIWTKRSSVRI